MASVWPIASGKSNIELNVFQSKKTYNPSIEPFVIKAINELLYIEAILENKKSEIENSINIQENKFDETSHELGIPRQETVRESLKLSLSKIINDLKQVEDAKTKIFNNFDDKYMDKGFCGVNLEHGFSDRASIFSLLSQNHMHVGSKNTLTTNVHIGSKIAIYKKDYSIITLMPEFSYSGNREFNYIKSVGCSMGIGKSSKTHETRKYKWSLVDEVLFSVMFPSKRASYKAVVKISNSSGVNIGDNVYFGINNSFEQYNQKRGRHIKIYTDILSLSKKFPFRIDDEDNIRVTISYFKKTIPLFFKKAIRGPIISVSLTI